VRGTLDAIAALSAGAGAPHLAVLAGVTKATILKRLRGLVALGLVEQRPDRGNPRGMLYLLATGTPAVLAALDTALLNPQDAHGRALRALADVSHRSVGLDPGTQARKQAEAALATALRPRQ
jgi:DNA-binding IclR family transcriptional regulator